MAYPESEKTVYRESATMVYPETAAKAGSRSRLSATSSERSRDACLVTSKVPDAVASAEGTTV